MPKAVKILLWIGVFVACAGVGAYVAAHTDPFPPGVDDPGANAAGPVSTEVPSGGIVVLIDTRTSHDLYVGGRCAISWRIELGLGAADGTVDGSGVATAKSELRCDEPTAQVQAERTPALAPPGRSRTASCTSAWTRPVGRRSAPRS